MSDAQPARHSRMFEYLRQQHLADVTARRIADEQARTEVLDAQAHMGLAHASWRRADTTPRTRASSAIAGRDHEFFRAVRA